MHRKTLALTAVCALTFAACSGTPETLLSPTSAAPTSAALNPDGSSLKVTPPTGLSPNGDQVLNNVRPTLTFTPATGRFGAANLQHELEIVNANEQVVYHSGSVSSPHGLTSDLTYSDNFWWRVRARLGEQFGPWSEWAPFRTPEPPSNVPSAGTGGGLPFPVPPECGPFGSGNRIACVLAVAARSAEWQGCRAGSGLRCHRFTRQVAYALSQSDGNWRLIQAQPGGHACNCSRCGSSDGTMLREDTVVYGGNRVFDMITGAGGPNPGLSWSSVPGPRRGDIPVSASVCR